MASKEFKKLFLLRFITYFATLCGFLAIVLEIAPVIGVEFNFRKDELLGIKHTLSPQVVTSQGTLIPSPPPQQDSGPGFGSINTSSESSITPVSTDYGIVIEKINANAKIIPDVPTGNEKEYIKALTQGVAEASGSTKPGEPGNLFLFSHSTDAPWNIVRYNAIFYLLRELEKGDRVIIFYQGRRYDYIVFDKNIAKGDDISFITNRYDKPVLTLQTCDPPGTILNRLIIRAKLQSS